MKVLGYVTLDPKGDRPYFSSRPPAASLDRSGGVRVFSFELEVEDLAPVEDAKATNLKEI